MSSKLNQLYSPEYPVWKKWERLFVCSKSQERYFEQEFSGIDFAGKKLLEIGFGDGSFLRWTHDRKARAIVGCELIESLCASGIAHGYDTRLGDVRKTVDPTQESFDLVIAFDVLEHIPPHELLGFMQFIGSVMAPGALFLVRVPNGQSPFGLINQYGDITHVNVLSKGRFEQIAPRVGLEMLYCRNACRSGTPGSRWSDTLRFKLRDGVNAFISRVYGLGHTPLDPNIVACFRNAPVSRQQA